MKSFLKIALKFSIVCSLLGSVIVPHVHIFDSLFNNSIAIAQASASIENWWPTENTTMEGVQPFKAVLPNTDIKTYEMFWQVDGGQLNKMSDNYNDYPHKEATVDLSGWKWHDNGHYQITFVAKDANGATLGEKSISIYTNKTATVSTLALTPTQAPTTPTIQVASPKPVVTPAVVIPIVTTSPTPSIAPQSQSSTYSEEVWWPTQNASITGAQPFKATLTGVDLGKYTMSWQVDDGQMNTMNDSLTDAPHKEALVDISSWNWKGKGPYTLTFTAKDLSGKVLGTKNISITNSAAATVVATPVLPSTSTTISAPAVPAVTATIPGNPFSGSTFYVNPNSNAKLQADAWRNSRPSDALLMDKIASMPDAKWIGNWNADVKNDVKNYVDQANKTGSTPVMIAYNIPGRDCGSYSAGGAANAEAYTTWIRNFADGIGNRKAVVILEPDALAGISCLDAEGQASRLSLLKNAISTFKAEGNVTVYLDAGHSNWIGAEDMAARLKHAGIEKADGFALNVSNYNLTSDQITYGTKISALVGGKHFIVDTSRNGQGPLGSEWCNPSGRGLGKAATTNTGNPLVDAFMWLKNPGESDGTCNGGPSAGVWWPEYALGLAKRAEL